MASQTYQNLLQQPYYQYGDFKVTGDWKYTQAQQSDGQNYLTFYDPKNSTQNFTLNAQNLPEYLIDYVRDAKGQLNNAVVDPLASGFYSAGTKQGVYNPTQNLYGFDSGQFYLTPDYLQLLQNRNLTNQIGSGSMSVDQATRLANQPTNVTTPTLTQAQQYTPPTPGSGMTYADRVLSGETNQSRSAQTSSKPSPSQGLSFNDISANQQGLSRDQIASRAQSLVPITQVSLMPSAQTTSTQLSNPKTSFDIQSILTQNQSNYTNFVKQQQALQQQYLSALKPDPAMTKLQQQLNDLKTQMLNTNLSAEGGIQDVKQKLVPMRAIIGEQQNIVEQANLKLKTLAAMQAPLVDQLQLAQSIRTQQLQGLEAMMNFGLQNYKSGQEQLEFLLSMNKYQRELDQLSKQEQQSAKDFALENNITSPFYSVGGTIYRTSDGKAYSTPDEFFADGGASDFSNAPKINVPENIDTQIVTANGRTLLINSSTGDVIKDLGGAYKTSSGGGRSGATTITPSKELTRVKQIIASHPGEWGHAADQIDNEFPVTSGMKTSTKYDDLLKAAYAQDDTTTFLSPQFFIDTYNLDSNQANEYMTAIEAYRQAGFTDREILKMMQ